MGASQSTKKLPSCEFNVDDIVKYNKKHYGKIIECSYDYKLDATTYTFQYLKIIQK